MNLRILLSFIGVCILTFMFNIQEVKADDEIPSLETDVFNMTFSNVIDENDESITYRLRPADRNDFPRDAWFYGVFSKDKLNHSFPKGLDFEDRVFSFTAKYESPIKEGRDDINYLDIESWGIHSENSSLKDDIVEIKSVLLEEGEFIHYEVTSLEETGINRLSLKRPNIPDNFPSESIVGSTLMVKGVISTSDNKTLDVRDWMFLDKKEITQKEEKDPKLYEIYGRSEGGFFMDDSSDSIITWAKFVDHDGNEYLVEWNSEYVRYSHYQIHGNFTLTVSDLPSEGDVPKVRVHNYKEEDEDYEFQTDDVISLVGKIEGKVNEVRGRTTYKFTSNERTFYAVFDEDVLKGDFPTSSLKGYDIELTGVSYRQGSNIFLGVMGYRFPFADSNYGQGNAGVNYETITGTPVYLISYGTNSSAYKVITNNGIEHTFIFDKQFLNNNFPTQIITGQEFKFTVIFDKQTKRQNSYYVLGMDRTGEKGYEEDRGKFLKLITEGHSTSRYLFESIEGRQYIVSMNAASVNSVGGAKKVVGTTAIIYGKESVASGERIFDIYLMSPVNTPHVNKHEDDTVSFRGFVKKITQRDPKGITFFAENQYGQSEYFYIETDFLKNKFPASMAIEDILSKEITVSGYKMKNGIILVKDFGFPKVPDKYPEKFVPEIEEPEYFPNMQGFTGVLDISDIGGSHLMLITSTDKYILNGKPEVMKQIENNLRNMVYLRGEYREAGAPYWTGEIKVYDIKFLDRDTNTITKPKSDPVHDLKPDPQKDAILTLQLHDLPEEFEYGNAIPEAGYFPEIPIPEDLEYIK